MRLEGASARIREAYPAEYTDLMVFITDFGGADYLVVILALLFWLTRRRQTAILVAYAITGAAFILTMKTLIGWDRPPDDVWVIEYETDPYGFPSGHAFISTLIYGGILYRFDLHRHWAAVGGVVALIVLVSLSRVVLGLHYLGDLLVGAALGLALLVALELVVKENRRLAFGVALVSSAIGASIVGPSIQTAWILLGFGIGGAAFGHRVEELPPLRSRVEGAVLTVLGLGCIAIGITLETVLTDLGSTFVEVPLMIALYAVLIVVIMLLPEAVGRLEHDLVAEGLGDTPA